MSEPREYEVDGDGRVYARYDNGEVLPTGIVRRSFAGKSHITPEAFNTLLRQPASEPASEPVVALARIRELCCEGHGDDLIAEVADAALVAARGDTP